MDPSLKNFIFSKPDIVTIEYHTNFPYLFDVFYTANQAENNARTSYYPITFVPSNRFDGTTSGGTSPSNWQTVYDARKAIPSRVRIELTGLFDPAQSKTTGTLDARLIAETTLGGGDWTLQTAITESDIDYMAGNGINVHHHVMRKMLPDAQGTSVSFSGPYPDTVDVSLNFTIDPSWVDASVAFAAFLQDEETMEVEQSAVTSLANITVDVIPGDPVPATFGIDSVRPNPFNPLTTVTWSAGTQGPVTLVVYDIAGRAVRTLVRGAAGGSGSATWDGRTDDGAAAASGIYRFVLTNGKSRSVRSGVLVR